MYSLVKEIILKAVFLYMVFITIIPIHALGITLEFSGTIFNIDEDSTSGIFPTAVLGERFSGRLNYSNDPNAASSATTQLNEFSCNFQGSPYGGSLESEGVSVSVPNTRVSIINNFQMDEMGADIFSKISPINSGTEVDVWAASGVTSGSVIAGTPPNDDLRDGLEFGLFLISRNTLLYTDHSYQSLPPNLLDIDFPNLFVEQADADGNTLYSVDILLDELHVVPIPAALWLFLPSLFILMILNIRGRRVR